MRVDEGRPICDCAGVTAAGLCAAFAAGARDVEAVARETGATTGCGGCRRDVARLLRRLRWRARLRALTGR